MDMSTWFVAEAAHARERFGRGSALRPKVTARSNIPPERFLKILSAAEPTTRLDSRPRSCRIENFQIDFGELKKHLVIVLANSMII